MIPNSNTLLNFLLTIILSVALFACQTAKKSIDAASTQEASLVISIKKTACYGTCPVYELQIYSDLSVTLKGEQYVDKIGEFQASINQVKLNELKDLFRDADFFSFEDKYWEAFTDLPTTYVYFTDGGKSKKIMDYHGAPRSLKELENEVAKLLDELEWTKNEG